MMLDPTKSSGAQGIPHQYSTHEGEQYDVVMLDDGQVVATYAARRAVNDHVRGQFARQVKKVVKAILKGGMQPGDPKCSRYIPAAYEAVRMLRYVRGVPLDPACQRLADDVVDLLQMNCPPRDLDGKEGGIFYFVNIRPMDYLRAFIALDQFCRQVNVLQRERKREKKERLRKEEEEVQSNPEELRRLKKARSIAKLWERFKMAKEARRRAGEPGDISQNDQANEETGERDQLAPVQQPLTQLQGAREQEAQQEGSPSAEGETDALPEGLLLPKLEPLPLGTRFIITPSNKGLHREMTSCS